MLTALKNLIFTIVVPGSVTVLFPMLLLRGGAMRVELGALRFAGLPLMALGGLIYLWTVWDFATLGRGTPAPIDAPRVLVARGLYRTVRNPMYVGVLSVLAGEALFFESALLGVYAGLIGLAFHLFVVYYEEPTLRRTFGEAYVEFCQRVPRWLPRLRSRADH